MHVHQVYHDLDSRPPSPPVVEYQKKKKLFINIIKFVLMNKDTRVGEKIMFEILMLLF